MQYLKNVAPKLDTGHTTRRVTRYKNDDHPDAFWLLTSGQCLAQDGDPVKKGQHLCDITEYDGDVKCGERSIYAPCDGIVRFADFDGRSAVVLANQDTVLHVEPCWVFDKHPRDSWKIRRHWDIFRRRHPKWEMPAVLGVAMTIGAILIVLALLTEHAGFTEWWLIRNAARLSIGTGTLIISTVIMTVIFEGISWIRRKISKYRAEVQRVVDNA